MGIHAVGCTKIADAFTVPIMMSLIRSLLSEVQVLLILGRVSGMRCAEVLSLQRRTVHVTYHGVLFKLHPENTPQASRDAYI